MGAADVVPGVSGGTMALITGIYEELILSIRSFDARSARLLIGLRIRALLDYVRWPFLCALVAGILVAIFSLSRAITYLLENEPVFLWSFFFGLVLASVFTVGRRIPQWNLRMFLGAVGATLCAYFLVGLVPVEMPHSPPYIFCSAVVAICAMILPGISGSFVLVLLGQYPYLLNALNTRDLFTIALFGAGAVVGLMAFSRVLNWFFRHYHDFDDCAVDRADAGVAQEDLAVERDGGDDGQWARRGGAYSSGECAARGVVGRGDGGNRTRAFRACVGARSRAFGRTQEVRF